MKTQSTETSAKAPKHTAVKWQITRNPENDRIHIEAEGGLNNGYSIAVAYGSEREAIARLIAAAPELLAALKTALLRLGQIDRNETLPAWALASAISTACAAITKAEGA